jgi:hypothetical protein
VKTDLSIHRKLAAQFNFFENLGNFEKNKNKKSSNKLEKPTGLPFKFKI